MGHPIHWTKLKFSQIVGVIAVFSIPRRRRRNLWELLQSDVAQKSAFAYQAIDCAVRAIAYETTGDPNPPRGRTAESWSALKYYFNVVLAYHYR